MSKRLQRGQEGPLLLTAMTTDRALTASPLTRGTGRAEPEVLSPAPAVQTVAMVWVGSTLMAKGPLMQHRHLGTAHSTPNRAVCSPQQH